MASHHSNSVSISDPSAKAHLLHARESQLGQSDQEQAQQQAQAEREEPDRQHEVNWSWVSGNGAQNLPEPRPDMLPTLRSEDNTPADDPDNIVARSHLPDEVQLQRSHLENDDVVYVDEPDGTADLTG